MTRVYEASKRASVPPAAGPASISAEAADRSSVLNESVFERYSHETHASGDGSSLPSPHAPEVAAASAIERPRISLFRSLAPPPSPVISLDRRLIAKGEILPAQIEQYRRLSAVLQDLQDRSQWPGHSAIERGLKTLLVTSALPREGKTLTVVNVASALSDFHGRRVLVIDACLHGPSIHQMLGLPNVDGLGDILRSQAQDPPLLQVSPLMSILPAGRCVPSQISQLTSNRMRALLDECSSRFDWVLLDAPPVSLLPDPRLLARFVRSVLLVIASGSTPIRAVEKAASHLGRSSVIGAVLNRVDSSS